MTNRTTATESASCPRPRSPHERLSTMATQKDRPLQDPNAELLAALRKRAPEAFGLLMRNHERRLRCTAMRITGNHEDAEDAVQHTFFQVYRNIDGFRGECQFTSWLTRIAINQALMLLRRKRHLTVSIDDCPDDGTGPVPRDLIAPCHTPEESFLEKELSERLMGALRKLRVGNRGVAELHYLKQLTTEEIASAMGISIAATKSRLLRARQQLRRDGPTQLQPSNRRSSTLYLRTQSRAVYSSLQG